MPRPPMRPPMRPPPPGAGMGPRPGAGPPPHHGPGPGMGRVRPRGGVARPGAPANNQIRTMITGQTGAGPGSMSGKKRPSQKSFNEPPAKRPNYSNQQPPPQRQHFSQQPQQHYSRGGPSQPQPHHHRAQNNYTQPQPHQQHHQHHQHQQQHHHASHPRQQTPVPEFNGQCHSNFRSIPLVDSAPPPADARPPPNTATGRIGLPVTSVNWNWNGSSSDQNDAKNKLDSCGALESDMRCYIKKAVEVTWLKNPLTSVKECRQFIEQNNENQIYNMAKVSKNSLRCQVHRTLNNLKTCGSIHKKRPGPRVKYGISVKNNILQLALNRKQQR